MKKEGIKTRLRNLEKRLLEAGTPQPGQVAEAMIHHAETGQWSQEASPRIIALAEQMQRASAAIMGAV
jgi:hypothetical protein